ncbi:MAG: type II toxin-antitoxin system YafQ family toxin [Tannerella sp.]|jgi:hypothetical protein|nr:type II toxin-antitoxin system YafQ family toxin [Tannerella sp.]
MAAEKIKRKTADEFFKALESYDNFIYNAFKTNVFKKTVKLSYKRNLDLNLLEEVIVTVAKGEKLDEKYFPHPLKGAHSSHKCNFFVAKILQKNS